MRKLRAVALVVSIGLSLAGFSQSTNATLGGTVQDPTKAFVPADLSQILPEDGNNTFGRITTAGGSRSFVGELTAQFLGGAGFQGLRAFALTPG